MFQGFYKGTGNSEILQEGKKYYLFPNGEQHYYVSPFPNEGAHTGCYQASRFELVEDEGLYPELDREKHYSAELIYRRSGYSSTPLKRYYIQPKKTHAYFWEDSHLTQFRGCFPLEWFDHFVEFEVVPVEEIIIPEVIEPEVIIEEPQVSKESKQLSLFDF
jgi:hypothetical protein